MLLRSLGTTELYSAELMLLFSSSSCFLIMHARRVCVCVLQNSEQMQTLSVRGSCARGFPITVIIWLARRGGPAAPPNQQLSDMCSMHKLSLVGKSSLTTRNNARLQNDSAVFSSTTRTKQQNFARAKTNWVNFTRFYRTETPLAMQMKAKHYKCTHLAGRNLHNKEIKSYLFYDQKLCMSMKVVFLTQSDVLL